MSIIPDSAKVRVKPTMTGRDPWAFVVEIARTERLRKGDHDKGHDPYNHHGHEAGRPL